MPDEADDVAVGVAVVVEHVDEAGAAGSDHDVVAHGDRRPVLRRLADLDADLRDVALLAIGGRVVEDVSARCGGVEEELPVGGQRDVELVDGLTLGAHKGRLLSDEQRVVVGVGVVVEHVEPHGLADDGDARVVAGVRLVVGVLQPHVDDHRAGVGRPEIVADRVRQLDALGRAVRVGGEDHLARRIAHEDASRARRVGEIDRLEDEGVPVGIDVVREDVECRRPAPAGRGDVVVRFRWPVRRAVGRADLHTDGGRGRAVATVGDRVVERHLADVAGGGRHLHAAAVRGDLQDCVAARLLDRLHEEHVAVRVGVVGQHVHVERAVDASLCLVVASDGRPVRALRVDLIRLHDLHVRVVGIDLREHLAAVLVGVLVVEVVALVREDRSPVLDLVETLLRAGHPRRTGVDVVDPHPAVDEAQP